MNSYSEINPVHSRSYLTYLICKSYALYYLIISTFIYILIFGILLGWSWESWQIIFVSCFLYFTFVCYVTIIWIYLVYTRLKTTCKKHILIKKSHSRNNLNLKKKKRNTNSEFTWLLYSYVNCCLNLSNASGNNNKSNNNNNSTIIPYDLNSLMIN